MIYLDNAATSWPKPLKVYSEMDRCLREYCANPGRGGHQMSLLSGKAVYETREITARFFNISNPLRIVFTKNATEALNIAIKGILKEGDHVVTTCMEHNSVIRPLKTLERDNKIQLTIVKGNEFGEIDVSDVEDAIKPNTRLIVSTLSSNVNGIIMPVGEIGKLARERGVLFLLDASQGAGSIPINIEKIMADAVACPGHKGLLGPQGTGILYVREGIKLQPLMQGGTGSKSEIVYQPDMMPDMLESGTLNTPGIVGLGCGIRFIDSIGVENLRIYKHKLTERLYDGLAEIKGVKLYGRRDWGNNSGILAFNVENMDSTEVSYLLDKDYNIASRAGLHCAPLAHETLGTLRVGIVRLSLGIFNTIEEIDFTINAVREITEKRTKV